MSSGTDTTAGQNAPEAGQAAGQSTGTGTRRVRLRALVERRTVVLVGLLGAGIALLGLSRPWGLVEVPDLASFGDIEISGSQAAPAGTAVALAVGAACLVLTIAGRMVRFVIPVGLLVAGVALTVSGVTTLDEPTGAAANALRETLNLGGGADQGFDYTAELNLWGWIYVAGAVVIAVAGVLGILGSRGWQTGGRRFERAGADAASRPAAVGGWSSSADVWDAQNRGEDLTEAPQEAHGATAPDASAAADGRSVGDESPQDTDDPADGPVR